ncbi:MAG: peptidase MA family metallohydrolase [Candidatus Omnitrophica bacterium]|nr:peptidase MA family metallohydrolase [Candidatus Omnitrophota bacterium]
MWLLLCTAAYAEEWKDLKGEHFVVFYRENPVFAQEVLTRAERYYQGIASDLGYSRSDNFWQWENRAKIYIYRNQAEFLAATGKKPWIHGTAFYDKREIVSYKWDQGFLDVLLPHELCHLIFRDFVGFKGEVPLWLDEGVAQWEETRRRKQALEVVRVLIARKEYIPLKELTRIDSNSDKDPVLSSKLYAQAATLVGYLIETYGPSKFALFCRQLRDGQNMDAALSFVYTDSINNTDELEKKWSQHYGGT